MSFHKGIFKIKFKKSFNIIYNHIIVLILMIIYFKKLQKNYKNFS